MKVTKEDLSMTNPASYWGAVCQVLNFHIWRGPYLCIKEYAKNKSPGNDGLTNEFHETFWNELKIPFMASLRKSFLKEELSISQKQAVIRITERKKTTKKNKDRRFIQNWRPLPLLNTDVKIFLKVIAPRQIRLFLF